jgi:hypothetical protein
MAACTNYGAWFHYEDGTPDGAWVLLIIAPGGTFPAGYFPGPLPTPSGDLPFIYFDPALNPIIAPVLKSLNRFGTPVSIEVVAHALYVNAQTAIPQYSHRADDYAIGCADAAPAGMKCPPGMYFDPATELCKPLIRPVIVPTPIIPPPPPGPPPNPTPLIKPIPADSEGDELERCCAQTALQMYNIALAIQGLAQARTDDTCCLEVVQELAVIATSLQEAITILNAPPPAPGAPPDFTAIVVELKCVCEKLTAISTSSATVANDLAPGLKSIADAVAKGTDVSQIVEQLRTANDLNDIPLPILKQLFGDKVIPKQYSALLQGSPASWVHAVLQAAAAISPIIGFLEHLAGDDADLEGGERMAAAWVTTISATFAKLAKEVAGMPTGGPPTDLSKGFKAFLKANDTLLLPIISPLIDAITAGLKPAPGAAITLGDIQVNPDAPVASATGVALTAGIAAWALSFAGIDEGESLTHISELIAGAIGWEELRDVQIRPLVQYGIERVAEMKAKSTFRQEVPGVNALAQLAARGILTPDRFGQLAGFTGVPLELQEPSFLAAHSGLNARMLLRLAGTGLFTDADVADELTFGGMRQSSQHRLIAAAAFLGTEPERHKFLGTLERLYAAGLISDNNFIQGFDSAQHNTDRHDLTLRTVQLEKQIALAKEYEASYSHEFVNGLLDAPGYQAALEALGMQPPDVAARMFRDESHIAVTQTLGAERLAKAEARKTAAENRKTAIEGFRTGLLNLTDLTTALSLAGLTPAQTAAEVGYQVLAQAGALRWIYGRHLSPQDATLLRQQVQDLTRQREIELLTDAQYVAQLTALSIPPRVIQALRAGADAHISPKTKAILTPPVVA